MYSARPNREIREMKFDIISPAHANSIAQITINDQRTFSEDGKPRPNAIFDPRFGVYVAGKECANDDCGCGVDDCPGHFGKIQLAVPVIHPHKQRLLRAILITVCWKCGEFVDDALSREAIRKLPMDKRAAYVVSKTRTAYKLIRCTQPGCDKVRPTVTFMRKGFCFYYHRQTDVEKGTRLLRGDKIKRILARIPRRNYLLLGIRNYDIIAALLIETLLVMPLIGRVYMEVQSKGRTMRAINTINERYQNVLAKNLKLEHEMRVSTCSSEFNDNYVRLQCEVCDLFDSKDLVQSKRQYHMPCSLTTRIVGKTGRIRGNIMGKRVDHCARSVIGPDPAIDIEEVGIPRLFAAKLTKPVAVNRYNVNELNEALVTQMRIKELLPYKGFDADLTRELDQLLERQSFTIVTICQANGRAWEGHPSMKRQFQPIEEVISIPGIARLEIGDTIERTLKNGDYVVLNRQPTLHAGSMLAMRVRILPYSSIRLNLCDVVTFNADFDGDEMNIHVPQSIEAEAEMDFMSVANNLVDPAANRMLIGPHMDATLGLSKLSRRGIFFTRAEMCQLMMELKVGQRLPIPAILLPTPLWTGKQLISLIFPPNVQYGIPKLITTEELFADERLLIVNGSLLSGVLTKSTVGVGAGQLLCDIYHCCTSAEVCRIINDLTHVADAFLSMVGFSVGIADTIVAGANEARNRLVDKTIRKVEDELKAATDPEHYTTMANMTVAETCEARIADYCNTLSYKGDRFIKQTSHANGFMQMVDAGSKGSHANIRQISLALGQQYMIKARMDNEFRKKLIRSTSSSVATTSQWASGRTLPHYDPAYCHTNGSRVIVTKPGFALHHCVTRGLATHSLLEGLTPAEFFFHAKAGRVGEVNRAIRTSDTGYLNAQLVKCLESICVSYNGNVVDTSDDRVISFAYGDDGVDIRSLTNMQWQLSGYTEVTAFIRDLVLPLTRHEHGAEKRIYECEKRSLEGVFAELQALKGAGVDIGYYRLQAPLFTLLSDAQRDSVEMKVPGLPVTRKSHWDGLQDYSATIEKMYEDGQLPKNTLFDSIVCIVCSSKQIIETRGLCEAAFVKLLNRIVNFRRRNAITPGTAVGVIAANAIGRKAQQETLDTFHYTGSSSHNVVDSIGVLRKLTYCMDCVNKSQSNVPNTATIYARKESGETWATLQQIRAHFITVRIGDLIDSQEIHNDPDAQHTSVFDDANEQSTVNGYHALEVPHTCGDFCLCRFLIRYRLSLVAAKQRVPVDPETVRAALRQYFGIDNILEDLYIHGGGCSYVLRLRLANVRKKLHFGKCPPTNNLKAMKKWYKRRKRLLYTISQIQVNGIPDVDLDLSLPQPYPAIKSKTFCLTTTSAVSIGTVIRACDNRFDFTRTICDNPPDVAAVLGIEAARTVYINELRKLLQGAVNGLNTRHIALLADYATQPGYLVPFNYYGCVRRGSSPWQVLSFERAVTEAEKFAMLGTVDRLSTPSSAVALGKMANVGTGYFEMFLDTDKVVNNPYARPDGDMAEPSVSTTSSPDVQMMEYAPMSPAVGNFSPYNATGDDDVEMAPPRSPGPHQICSLTSPRRDRAECNTTDSPATWEPLQSVERVDFGQYFNANGDASDDDIVFSPPNRRV